jgi:hypothetical protein
MVINKRAAPLWKTQVPGQAVTKVIHTCCMVLTIPLARPRFRQTVGLRSMSFLPWSENVERVCVIYRWGRLHSITLL